MRVVAALIAAALLPVFPAAAIPYFPPPQPVYEAPIDRALSNVQATQGMEPAQRERLLARLNLLAYARDDATFTYLRDGDQLNEAGSVLCAEAPRSMRSQPPQAEPEFGPDDRCAQLDFQLGPRDEVPTAAPSFPGNGATTRLQAARTHYERAIGLESNNLRARLGHAYVLDRLGRTNEARRELRNILRLGLPRLAGPQADWEDHVVLTEAAEHLVHLATNKADRAKMQRLRERLQASRPMMYITPIVVPLTDGAFSSMVDTASPVSFDFAGTGDQRAQGWLNQDAAWLVWDPNWRSDIRSGFDLIGQRSWSVFWSDGFEALRALDDNGDGALTGRELGGLALWQDANGDGKSDASEVIPVEAHGIVGLSTHGARRAPGLITAPRGVYLDNGRTRPLYDWTPGMDVPVS